MQKEMRTPKKKSKCIVCGFELSKPLFVLPNMPAGAQAMPDKAKLKSDRGIELPLCRCPECGLYQFDCEPVDYYKDAIRVVGLSETMRNLRRSDYRHLMEDYGLKGAKFIECGCGNGDFLEVLKEFPADIYGMEAGEGNVAEAKEKLCADGTVPESHIMRLFPDSGELKVEGGPFDCFLSFNFLEHQPDPVSMLKCMYNNLKDGGFGLISVPAFEYIIKNGRYYELIRDHIANYDMDSLKYLVNMCGFEVIESRFVGIGDTIEFLVKKGAGTGEENAPTLNLDTAILPEGSKSKSDKKENERPEGRSGGRSLDTAGDGSVLKDDYIRMREEIADYMSRLKASGRSLALWGAGHQGFTIASTTALKDNVRYIIDSSEKKQGLFAPASHIPIVSPERYLKDPVDVIMIAAPGYIREIESTIRESFKDRLPAICDVIDMTER